MEWINKYIGLLYQDRGRGPTHYDCWGLVWKVLSEEFKYNIPSYAESYQSYKQPHVVEMMIDESLRWKKIKYEEEKLGDVLHLVLRGIPRHAAVVIEKGKMLHIMEGIDACIERYNTPLWKQRIIGIYRWI